MVDGMKRMGEGSCSWSAADGSFVCRWRVAAS